MKIICKINFSVQMHGGLADKVLILIPVVAIFSNFHLELKT
jgi:hypothetical protein